MLRLKIGGKILGCITVDNNVCVCEQAKVVVRRKDTPSPPVLSCKLLMSAKENPTNESTPNHDVTLPKPGNRHLKCYWLYGLHNINQSLFYAQFPQSEYIYIHLHTYIYIYVNINILYILLYIIYIYILHVIHNIYIYVLHFLYI